MVALIALLTFTSTPVSLGNAQDLPLRDPGSKFLKSKMEYESDGEHVVSETTGKLDFSLEELGPTPNEPYCSQPCFSSCTRKVHDSHKECDTSCDSTCSVDHSKDTANGYVELNLDVFGQYEGFHYKDAPHQVPFEHEVKGLTNEIIWEKGYNRLSRHLPKGHFSKPCTSVLRVYHFKRYGLRAKGTLTTIASTPKRKHDWTKEVDHIVAFIDILDPTVPPKTEQYVNCVCDRPVSETPPPTTNPGDSGMFDTIYVNEDGTAWQPTDPNEPPPTTKKLVFKGNNLFQIDVGIGELPMRPYDVYFPPGLVFIPGDSGTQSVANVVGKTIHVPSMDEAWPWPAAFEAFAPASLSVDGVIPLGMLRTACLEMKKHEPKETVTFRPKAQSDPILSKLAKIVNDERSRGPWDQARIWIYTDKATMSEVNQIMSPGVPAGTYAKVLKQVEEAGVYLLGPTHKRCFTADLMLGSNAAPDTTRWVIDRLSGTVPKEVATFVKSNYAEFAKIGVPDQPDSIGFLRVTLDGLFQSIDPEVKALVPDFIAKALPPTIRKQVLEGSYYQATIDSMKARRDGAEGKESAQKRRTL